jgi:hypothetical protein
MRYIYIVCSLLFYVCISVKCSKFERTIKTIDKFKNDIYKSIELKKSNNLKNKISKFIENNPFIMGKWIIRTTNDDNLKKYTYSYVEIFNDRTIKLKSIKLNKLFGTKISRTGEITNIEFKNSLFDNLNEIDKLNIIVCFNLVTKYTYSFCGIEFPEIKYNSKENYELIKKINVIQNKKSIYVYCDLSKKYYIFDLNYSQNKLPHSEITIESFLLTQFLGILINISIVHFLQQYYAN